MATNPKPVRMWAIYLEDGEMTTPPIIDFDDESAMDRAEEMFSGQDSYGYRCIRVTVTPEVGDE